MSSTRYAADRALVSRVLANDRRAYEELMSLIAPVIDERAARANKGAADDLKQELYMMLMENEGAVLRSYEGRSALSTFIYAVATRFFFRRVRRAQKTAQRFSSEHEPAELRSNEPSPETQALEVEQIRGVRSAIAQLESDEQLLLRMMYEQEASSPAVGRVLGISDAGVRMKKKRVLAKLAGMLEGLWP